MDDMSSEYVAKPPRCLTKDFATAWVQQDRCCRLKECPSITTRSNATAVEVNTRVPGGQITPIAALSLTPPVRVDALISKVNIAGTTMSLEQDAVETPGIANKAVESKYEVVYTGYGEAVGCSASICSQQYIRVVGSIEMQQCHRITSTSAWCGIAKRPEASVNL